MINWISFYLWFGTDWFEHFESFADGWITSCTQTWHFSLWWSYSWHSASTHPGNLASPVWPFSCSATWFGFMSLSMCQANGSIQFWKYWKCHSASHSWCSLASFASVFILLANILTTLFGPERSKHPRNKSKRKHKVREKRRINLSTYYAKHIYRFYCGHTLKKKKKMKMNIVTNVTN